MESLQRKKFQLIQVRTAVLFGLLGLPILVYAVVGTLAVWQMGWVGWLWWLIPAFWILGGVVAWLWPSQPTRSIRNLQANHWTPRDEQAAEIVRQYQNQYDEFSPEQLTDLHLYLNQAQGLADALAKHYHPDSTDPLTSLTVPEILAACRLVADDLEGLLLDSVPGSRMLTIGQWRKLGEAPKWIRHATNAIWAASILFNPLNVARYGASRLTNDRVATGVQTELLVTIYLRFIRQVGFYLIEMNSGRLRGGADLYRATFDRDNAKGKQTNPSAESKTPGSTNSGTGKSRAAVERDSTVKIALVGQTSAGKSSLINALIGQSAAQVDILPATATINRYQFQLDDQASGVTLLDTPGYGQSGASRAQSKQIEIALAESDCVLLVLDAHGPAREADQKTLTALVEHYKIHLHLKPPPILAVLTHIDLLSPMMEWSPPYNWESGASTKERSIAGAVEYTRDVLGDLIQDVVPVCTSADEDRQWGIVSNLVPRLIEHLDQARSVSLLAAFERGLSRDRVKILLRQTASSGKQIVRNWLQERFH